MNKTLKKFKRTVPYIVGISLRISTIYMVYFAETTSYYDTKINQFLICISVILMDTLYLSHKTLQPLTECILEKLEKK